MAVKAAIVGLGRIASLLEDDPLREKPCTHAGAISALAGLELCAGADISAERRRLFAERWNVPVYEDAQVLLTECRPDILHIATHPDSHLYYCSLAARAGLAAVVCEKPMADTLGDARKIAALHRAGKIKVLLNHERRYAADYRRARDILSGGTLGRACGVRAKLYMGKNRRLVDVLWHDGTHIADAAMFLSGGILRHRKTLACGRLARQSGTAYLAGLLDRPEIPACPPGPLPFLLELGAGRDHLAFELEFSCEEGRLLIGNGLFEVWKSRESPYAQGFRSLEKTAETFCGPTGYFINMAADALACALESRRKPVSSAPCGLAVIQYLHSIRAWR